MEKDWALNSTLDADAGAGLVDIGDVETISVVTIGANSIKNPVFDKLDVLTSD